MKHAGWQCNQSGRLNGASLLHPGPSVQQSGFSEVVPFSYPAIRPVAARELESSLFDDIERKCRLPFLEQNVPTF
ncbi:hypothetical protein SDC9_187788 [bioreactor metagenome]|uniref:Uncharacterized protein n=1 Tax=bioreactor metagenome TaxID=1076179 RepID=A0A645HP63_9ZZZZ